MLSSRPVLLFSLATLLFAATPTPAQTPDHDSGNTTTAQPSPAAAHYAFDVVSIRPSPPDAHLSFGLTEDGFRTTGMTLEWTILFAYFPVGGSLSGQLQNAPAWVSQNHYDVNAKVAPEDLDAWTHQNLSDPAVMSAMLMSMLKDRCHLQLHTIPAERQGFALTVSRHEASLRAATPGETIPRGMKFPDGGVAVADKLEDGTWTWHLHNASIASLINLISQSAHTRVLDQTGLTGRYDFDLTMAPDRPANNGGEITDPAAVWDLRALGLRTIPTKVPIVNLVIDHIDPPSPN